MVVAVVTVMAIMVLSIFGDICKLFHATIASMAISILLNGLFFFFFLISGQLLVTPVQKDVSWHEQYNYNFCVCVHGNLTIKNIMYSVYMVIFQLGTKTSN